MRGGARSTTSSSRPISQSFEGVWAPQAARSTTTSSSRPTRGSGCSGSASEALQGCRGLSGCRLYATLHARWCRLHSSLSVCVCTASTSLCVCTAGPRRGPTLLCSPSPRQEHLHLNLILHRDVKTASAEGCAPSSSFFFVSSRSELVLGQHPARRSAAAAADARWREARLTPISPEIAPDCPRYPPRSQSSIPSRRVYRAFLSDVGHAKERAGGSTAMATRATSAFYSAGFADPIYVDSSQHSRATDAYGIGTSLLVAARAPEPTAVECGRME